MKFKLEIWHSTTEFETIEIEAIDSFYALKYAREMYPKAIKINVKKLDYEKTNSDALHTRTVR